MRISKEVTEALQGLVKTWRKEVFKDNMDYTPEFDEAVKVLLNQVGIDTKDWMVPARASSPALRTIRVPLGHPLYNPFDN